jgi:predicted lipase
MVAAGHSLGGALATLAAFDIRRHLLDNMQSHAEVVCYTFAAPRTGNHAFAREYNAMVPDTWSVINDQVSLRFLPGLHTKPSVKQAVKSISQASVPCS